MREGGRDGGGVVEVERDGQCRKVLLDWELRHRCLERKFSDLFPSRIGDSCAARPLLRS